MYQTTISGAITFERDGVRYFVPPVEDNTDYQAFLAWLAEGNTPTEYQPPTTGQVTPESTPA